MKIWSVENKDWSRLRLWRIEQKEFLVIVPGDFKPLICCGGYTLMDEKYEEILKSLPGNVTTARVSVIDRAKNLILNNYIELEIKNYLDNKDILGYDYDKEPSSDELKLWAFNEGIIVTEALKRAFEKIAPGDFDFTNRFYFAANTRQ